MDCGHVSGRFCTLVIAAASAIGCGSAETVSLPTPVPPFRESTLQTEPIPQTLDQALDVLDRASSGQVYLHVWNGTEKATLDLHESVGRWIRNNWGLNQHESGLYRDLSQRGLTYAEDMSAVIFQSWWRRMHHRPIDVEGQVNQIRAFNEEMRRRARESVRRSGNP